MERLPDRALSIRQPWVWAILNAGKTIENRPRRFNYRGPICLHASLNAAVLKRELAFNEIYKASRGRCQPPRSEPFLIRDYGDAGRRGGIIGTAEIVDCIEESDSPWFFGPFGLVLENVQPVPFIPVKGALGLFRWKRNLTAEQPT